MKRWIADFEVVSHAVLPKGKGKIIFKDPQKKYEVHLSNLSVGPGLERQLLRVQIIFEAKDIELAYDISSEYLRSFLDYLSLVSSTSNRIHQRLRIIDWTKGLKKRECHQFQKSVDPNLPYRFLDEKVLESISNLRSTEIPNEVKKGLYWYGLGIRSNFPEDQFQFFWFSLEILAEFQKSSKKVPDKCPECDTSLFCPICKKVPTHRPVAKQALEALVKKVEIGDPKKVFKILNGFRNALMHARGVEKEEKKYNISFNKVVDIAGKIARAALINSFKPDKSAPPLFLIECRTYGHKEIHLKAIGQVEHTKTDPNDPKIENFSGTKITMEFSDEPPGLD